MTDFKSVYSNNFPKIIKDCGISLLISTYQAGKIIAISYDNGRLVQSVKNFDRPMGMYFHKKNLYVACRDEILTFNLNDSIINDTKHEYNSLLLPRVSYNTSFVDSHDICVDRYGSIVFANTEYSCLSKTSENWGIENIWKPPFISKIENGDRCHLNGVSSEDGLIKYITTFSKSNTSLGWKGDTFNKGTLIDISTDKILCDDLYMPHSPRFYEGYVYILESGTGTIKKVNPKNLKTENILSTKFFCRGLGIVNGVAFVGFSKIRSSNKMIYSPITKESECGVMAVDLLSNEEIGRITYHNSVSEIYDICAVPCNGTLGIISHNSEDSKKYMSTPNGSIYLGDFQ